MDIITAEEARNITANSSRTKLMQDIKTAATNGNSWVFDMKISKEDMEWLRSLGYRINPSYASNDACFIVWENKKD